MPKVIGEGTIEEKVRGKIYYIRHCIGKDPITKKYVKSPRRTVYGNKAEARRQLELYRIELEQGFANLEKVTLANTRTNGSSAGKSPTPSRRSL